jgi:hypothetical protein
MHRRTCYNGTLRKKVCAYVCVACELQFCMLLRDVGVQVSGGESPLCAILHVLSIVICWSGLGFHCQRGHVHRAFIRFHSLDCK